VSSLVAAARAGTAILVATHDPQVIAAADQVIDLIASAR
jgi:ABC-type lipoprotein export system ATPase subunit